MFDPSMGFLLVGWLTVYNFVHFVDGWSKSSSYKRRADALKIVSLRFVKREYYYAFKADVDIA